MFYHITFKIVFFFAFKVDTFSMKIYIVVTDVVNDVLYSRKSVKYRCSQKTFYYMTLFTEMSYDYSCLYKKQLQ